MKKYLILITIFISFIILTGCWAKKELNEMTLITAMAIDKSDRGFKLSIQVVVPKKAGGQNLYLSAPAAFFEADSENVCDAFRSLTNSLSRFPYLAHVNNIIISE